MGLCCTSLCSNVLWETQHHIMAHTGTGFCHTGAALTKLKTQGQHWSSYDIFCRFYLFFSLCHNLVSSHQWCVEGTIQTLQNKEILLVFAFFPPFWWFICSSMIEHFLDHVIYILIHQRWKDSPSLYTPDVFRGDLWNSV